MFQQVPDNVIMRSHDLSGQHIPGLLWTSNLDSRYLTKKKTKESKDVQARLVCIIHIQNLILVEKYD